MRWCILILTALWCCFQQMNVSNLIYLKVSQKSKLSNYFFFSDYVIKCIIRMTDVQLLGVIALEMIKDEIISDDHKKLCLQHSEQWSTEASNFVIIASERDLDKIISVSLKMLFWLQLYNLPLHQNRFLKCLSPTVMISFVEYVHWDTIESFQLNE